jgi:hypothetical protein
MKMTAALADMNGLSSLGVAPETVALAMARENGRSLWFEDGFSQDTIQFSSPIGPFGHVWDDPAPKIEEVYIKGEPRLAAARELVNHRHADAIVHNSMGKLTAPELQKKARGLADWVEERTSDWAN